ncbi:TlpA family protein disulfide reductase [Nocardioides sp. HDW12B]|uniref:TlpA family protein disulfide reductase n=1 Tax=Nocardioides sp. HDW12B TaxID=2714939 RepID=UPI001409D9F8|nr:TlpA disulfide reductase family protein [Nocardioides sp. HDW12B]QIK67648.1 TlpA family protein disulfide reductase [Nocardioides sp. HDW12B]
MTPWRAVQVAVVLVVAAVLTWTFVGGGGPDTPATTSPTGPMAEQRGEAGLPVPPVRTRVDVDTPALRAAKAAAGIEDCPPPSSPSGSASGSGAAPSGSASELPPLTLECLGGGPDTVLSDVAGPAVVNLWASWCGPCKEELPLLGELDRAAGDRLTVLGVDYQDPDPQAALGLLERAGATYPQLADPGGSLADQLRIRYMPGTVYVDADGRATFVNAAFTSSEELAALVREHTGVDVAAG